jgi:hypothetical protein
MSDITKGYGSNRGSEEVTFRETGFREDINLDEMGPRVTHEEWIKKGNKMVVFQDEIEEYTDLAKCNKSGYLNENGVARFEELKGTLGEIITKDIDLDIGGIEEEALKIQREPRDKSHTIHGRQTDPKLVEKKETNDIKLFLKNMRRDGPYIRN